MFKVILYPSKCPYNKDSWINKYKDGDEYNIAEGQYFYHIAHSCMKILSQYRIVYEKIKCKACGHVVNKKHIKVLQSIEQTPSTNSFPNPKAQNTCSKRC